MKNVGKEERKWWWKGGIYSSIYIICMMPTPPGEALAWRDPELAPRLLGYDHLKDVSTLFISWSYEGDCGADDLDIG
jgi:hypothetical protein